MPEQKRVYTARFEADISTRFEDWIERNLLEVERDQVDHIVLNEYTVDEVTRRASPPSEFTLDKVDDTTWNGSGVPEDQEVDFVEVNRLVGAIIGMRIAGVRPKPAGMTGNLRDAAMAGRIGQTDIIDLINKGFYPTAEGGTSLQRGRAARAHHRGRAVHAALRRDRLRPGRRHPARQRRERRRGGRTGREPLRLHHRGRSTRRPFRNRTQPTPTPMPPGNGGSPRGARRRNGWLRASPAGTTSSRPAATTASTSRAKTS